MYSNLWVICVHKIHSPFKLKYAKYVRTCML